MTMRAPWAISGLGGWGEDLERVIVAKKIGKKKPSKMSKIGERSEKDIIIFD